MTSLWSRVYKWRSSFRSQSMAFASLPPEAHREPSGDTVTVQVVTVSIVVSF